MERFLGESTVNMPNKSINFAPSAPDARKNARRLLRRYVHRLSAGRMSR